MLYKDVNRNNGTKLNKENLGCLSESIPGQQAILAHGRLSEAIEAYCLEQQARRVKTGKFAIWNNLALLRRNTTS